MKRKPIVVLQKDKEKYLKSHAKTAEMAFGGDANKKKKFIAAVRKKFGYSDKTIDGDVFSSFSRAWRSMEV